MADIAGKVGMLRIGGYKQATTIAFVEGGAGADTITDSGSGFLLAGFVAGDKISVIGSPANTGTFTIDTVVAGTITLDSGDDLIAESVGAVITIITVAPGQTVFGLVNFGINYNGEIVDVSTYETVQANDNNERDFIGTLTGWTLNAGGYYDTGETGEEDFVGRIRQFYIFVKYVASPSVPDPAEYYYGIGIITGINPDSAVDTVVNDLITIQGIGALSALTEKTSAW
jgi:hypothetical protein